MKIWYMLSVSKRVMTLCIVSFRSPISRKGEEDKGNRIIREGLAGIQGLACTIEVRVPEAVGVVVAAVGVAVAGEAVVGVGAAAVVLDADVVLVAVVAGVGGESVGVRVGLPDVDLRAAGAHATDTGSVVGLGRLPALNVTLQRVSAFRSSARGRRTSSLTLPLMNLRSRAHWASQ